MFAHALLQFETVTSVLMKYCTLCETVQSSDDDGRTQQRVAGFGVRLEECSKWTVPQQQNYEDRSGRSWLQGLPGNDARSSADNDGRGPPKLADTWWFGNSVRRCSDSWTSGHSACRQSADVLAASAEHHEACQTFAFGRPVLPQHWEFFGVRPTSPETSGNPARLPSSRGPTPLPGGICFSNYQWLCKSGTRSHIKHVHAHPAIACYKQVIYSFLASVFRAYGFVLAGQ